MHPPTPTPPQEVQLSDLQQLALLGAGGFGRVTLVKHKPAQEGPGAFFALKQMSKAYIKAQGLVRHVHREKQARAVAADPARQSPPLTCAPLPFSGLRTHSPSCACAARRCWRWASPPGW